MKVCTIGDCYVAIGFDDKEESPAKAKNLRIRIAYNRNEKKATGLLNQDLLSILVPKFVHELLIKGVKHLEKKQENIIIIFFYAVKLAQQV